MRCDETDDTPPRLAVADTHLRFIFLVACGQLEFSSGPLLYDVSFSKDAITPNADGNNDATEIKIACAARRM